MESLATKESAALGMPLLLLLPNTILVVEDEGFVRGVTCELLRESGYTVLEAADAAAARRLFAGCASSVNLLVCDVVLPDENGASLARALRRMAPALKVVLVSGYPAARLSGKSGRTRVARRLQKPHSAASLFAEIQLAMKGKHSRPRIRGRQSGAR